MAWGRNILSNRIAHLPSENQGEIGTHPLRVPNSCAMLTTLHSFPPLLCPVVKKEAVAASWVAVVVAAAAPAKAFHTPLQSRGGFPARGRLFRLCESKTSLEEISFSFSAFTHVFTCASRLREALNVVNRSWYTNLMGRRERVYLAPFPSLCSRSRVCKSMHEPAYRDPSRQRAR
jgi:hypothetical protein